MDEAVVFVLSVAVAASLIAAVGQYAIPAIAGAAGQEAEYAALRAVQPTLILASDGKTVHVCINSTLPASVLRRDGGGGWLQADRDCYISGGACAQGASGVFCAWYLGAYEVGDSVAFMLRGQHAAVVKNYTVAAMRPLS
jgi:hypothetical protein